MVSKRLSKPASAKGGGRGKAFDATVARELLKELARTKKFRERMERESRVTGEDMRTFIGPCGPPRADRRKPAKGGALRGCPFCGGEARVDGPTSRYSRYSIVCINDECWAQPSVLGHQKQVAVARWNRRAGRTPAPRVPSVEWLAEQMWELADYNGREFDSFQCLQRQTRFEWLRKARRLRLALVEFQKGRE